jgi:hypothetical protein
MPEYRTMPAFFTEEYDYVESALSIDVHCRDEVPVRTGLLDVHGNPLWRIPDARQIGFRIT